MAKVDHAWLTVKSYKYGVTIKGLLTIEFEDAEKAREALRVFVRTLGEALDAECELEKAER